MVRSGPDHSSLRPPSKASPCKITVFLFFFPYFWSGSPRRRERPRRSSALPPPVMIAVNGVKNGRGGGPRKAPAGATSPRSVPHEALAAPASMSVKTWRRRRRGYCTRPWERLPATRHTHRHTLLNVVKILTLPPPTPAPALPLASPPPPPPPSFPSSQGKY